MIDLILKDIDDVHSRENFFRLKNFINDQDIFNGNFKLFDVTIPSKVDSFKVLHGLSFIPADVIPLSVAGDFNFYFRFQEFDKDAMFITTDGPVRVRFLAGKLGDRVSGLRAPYPLVAPGDVVQPSSPGFVYGAIGTKTTGFWLTSEGIPSNVVGVPILFSDAVVIQAAVGTETESNYTVGIYQHDGAGAGLTLVGSFAITSGGTKRLDLSFPITPSTNAQLACRLLTGTTLNLKVSLILRGTGA